jgi:photosystem II stability/assembly factor-like uncharacterized protein
LTGLCPRIYKKKVSKIIKIVLLNFDIIINKFDVKVVLLGMKKYTIFLAISAVFLLSGCSLGGSSTGSMSGVLKSQDGGAKWEVKVNVDEKKNISAVDVLSLTVSPIDSKIVYIGTMNSGVFVSKDGAESWQQLNFPPTKNYALALNPKDGKTIYATGFFQSRGKIYKSENGGVDWKEIYTEPDNGAVVVSLALDKNNPDVLYAGNSAGLIFKTADGGKSWKNIFSASGAVTNIVFDSSSDSSVYFLVFNQGMMATKDGGASLIKLDDNMSKLKKGTNVFSLKTDPNVSGVVYAGLNGDIIKSADFGENWSSVNTLNNAKSSGDLSIRAMDINPQNSNEIIYSSAQAVYKSVDGGVQWSTFQLETSKIVGTLKYDPENPGTLYLGLRTK